MTTVAMRKIVHQYLDNVDDAALTVIYKMLKSYKKGEENPESLLTKGQKAELDKTLRNHKSGKLKYYTLDAAKKMVDKA